MNRAEAYDRWLHARDRWRRLNEAVQDGLWLGVMDPSSLAAFDQRLYDRLTESVGGADLRYAEPDYIRQGLHAWERVALAGLTPGGRVIVTAAGSGREVHGLTEMGFDAVGYEPHRGLVEAGRTVLDDPTRLRLSERSVFPPVEGRVDAVVIGWGSYMLIPGRERRVALLSAAAEVLHPGSLLLMSFFLRPRGAHLRRVHRIADPLRRLRGAESVEAGDALTPNFAHYFTQDEIAAEVRAANLEPVTLTTWPYPHLVAMHASGDAAG